MRVLIVDDNQDLCEALSELLGRRGGQVMVAFDGKEAVELASIHEFDAAIVDLRLPGCSGMEVLRVLTEATVPPTKLVMMTGCYESAVSEEELSQLNIAGVLRKPFDPTELYALLGLRAEAGSRPVSRGCWIATLGAQVEFGDHPELCHVEVDSFSDIASLSQALAQDRYSVVVLGGSFDSPRVVEDIKALDGDLAVTTSQNREMVVAAIQRSEVRRATTLELVTMQRVFENSESAMLVVEEEPPVVLAWNRALSRLLVGLPVSRLNRAALQTLEGSSGQGGALNDLVAEARAEEQVISRAVSVRMGGGRVRPLMVSATPLGVADRISLTFVPESRASAEALAMVGSTAAGVAHEMRNTLAGVSSSLSVLKGRLAEGTEEVAVIDQVLARVARGAEVISDLLVFARPNVPRPRAVSARLVLAAAVSQIAEEGHSDCLVRFECEDPSLNIVVDPILTQMALVNLGLNAVQAVDGPGAVVLSAAIVADQVELSVRDSGPGVPAEIRDDLFTPFFTTRARGSGLGLANVRKTIEAQGGAVELVSGAPETTFLCRLPLRPIQEEVIG